MIFVWIGITVLVTLCIWRLCAVASIADEQMEKLWEEMRQEREGTSLAPAEPPFVKEDADAG